MDRKNVIRTKINYDQILYQKLLQQEGDAWSLVAIDLVSRFGKPDYCFFKKNIYNRVYRRQFIEKELKFCKPGMKVLELGCASGWFSLELLRRGATIDAVDIAEGALELAKAYYQKVKIKERLFGNILYIEGDVNNINQIELNPPYDIVFARGILHHLPKCEELMNFLPKIMKDDSLLIIDDSASVYKYQDHLNAFNLIFFQRLLGNLFSKKKYMRINIYCLIRSLLNSSYAHSIVNAHTASPFESITEGETIETTIQSNFYVEKKETFSAFIGSLTCAFERYPQRLQNIFVPILRLLNLADRLFIKLKIAKGGILFIVAKPKPCK